MHHRIAMSRSQLVSALLALLFVVAFVSGADLIDVESTANEVVCDVYPLPRVHSTSTVSRLHPLLHFSVRRDDGSPMIGLHPDTPTHIQQKQDQMRRHRSTHLVRILKEIPYDSEEEASEMERRYDHTFPSSSHSAFPQIPHRTSTSGHIVQPYPDTLIFSVRLPSDEEDVAPAESESDSDDADEKRVNTTSTTVPELHTKSIDDIKLTIIKDIFDWDAPVTEENHQRVSIRTGDDKEFATMPRFLASYRGSWSTPDSSGWMVLTFHADGRFQLTLHEREGETYQVDLVEHHFQDLTSDEFDALSETTFQKFITRDTARPETHIEVGGHGMTVFSYRSGKQKFGEDIKCGTKHEHEDDNAAGEHSHAGNIDLDRITVPAPADENASPVTRHLLSVSQWAGCWSGQAVTQRVSIGIIADTAYYASYASNAASVQAAIAQLFSLANTIYSAQLNVILVNPGLIMYATTANTPLNTKPSGYTGANFNEARPCSIDINSKLTMLSNFKAQALGDRDAAWHLLSNCYSSGIVGVSFIGQLCNGWSIGISSRVTNHWLTFAHEIGHNFGAQHTIGLGGIMDYADGKYPTGTGQYMFHPNNQAQICPYISSVFKSAHATTPYCNQALTYKWAADSWGTCSCAGAQTRTLTCVGSDGNTYATTKCTATAPNTTQSCTIPSSCPTYTYAWVQGAWSTCSQSCGGGIQLATVTCYRTGSDGSSVKVANSYCTSTAPTQSKTCNTNPCPTYAWAVGTYTACNVTCGGGSQTRTVTCQQTLGSTVTTAASSLCSASTQPASSAICNTDACPPVSNNYYWYATASTTCSATCGGGLQYRVVYCAAIGSIVQVASTLCADAGTQPSALVKCNTQAC